jgi:hypothetical protein
MKLNLYLIAMYGMMAKIPDGAVVDEFLLALMAKAYA